MSPKNYRTVCNILGCALPLMTCAIFQTVVNVSEGHENDA